MGLDAIFPKLLKSQFGRGVELAEIQRISCLHLHSIVRFLLSFLLSLSSQKVLDAGYMPHLPAQTFERGEPIAQSFLIDVWLLAPRTDPDETSNRPSPRAVLRRAA